MWWIWIFKSFLQCCVIIRRKPPEKHCFNTWWIMGLFTDSLWLISQLSTSLLCKAYHSFVCNVKHCLILHCAVHYKAGCVSNPISHLCQYFPPLLESHGNAVMDFPLLLLEQTVIQTLNSRLSPGDVERVCYWLILVQWFTWKSSLLHD